MPKTIHAQEDLKAIRKKAIEVAEKLRKMKPKNAADLVENHFEETFYPATVFRRHTGVPFERSLHMSVLNKTSYYG